MKCVDADALADHLDTLAYDDWNQGIRLTWSDACKDLARIVRDDIPTVDAELVGHGQWIAMSDADGIYYVCSECGESLERKEHYDPQFDLFPRLKSIDKPRYCSNCGAKMEDANE